MCVCLASDFEFFFFFFRKRLFLRALGRKKVSKVSKRHRIIPEEWANEPAHPDRSMFGGSFARQNDAFQFHLPLFFQNVVKILFPVKVETQTMDEHETLRDPIPNTNDPRDPYSFYEQGHYRVRQKWPACYRS